MLAAIVGSCGPRLSATGLCINEVIAHNRTQLPYDFSGDTPAMVEIYSTWDSPIRLGDADPLNSYGLSNTLEQPDESRLWKFRNNITVVEGRGIVVFCDGNVLEDLCEPHANFTIANDGSHPISLWGPADPTTGTRPLIDQVWLPPMAHDVSIGRFPDGAGPAPVPVEEVLSTFVFNPPGATTFGSCIKIPAPTACPGGRVRICQGGENGPGGNVEPRVEILEVSTNSPSEGEPVVVTVRVEDEKEPTPPNIASVQAVYRVDGGPDEVVDFEFDPVAGIQHAVVTVEDDPGVVIDSFENPFNIWTLWRGTIPGQPAGAVVEFFMRCVDQEGLVDTSPETLCEDLEDPMDTDREPPPGPCDREFGGPGCWRDERDVACYENDPEEEDENRDEEANPVVGLRYMECSRRFRYTSGYEPPEPLRKLTISEVVARQTSILEDPSEADDVCDEEDPFCRYDDFIELHNRSSRRIDLSGLWLANSRFKPRGWQFPPGSRIEGGEHLIVWLDGDGGKCPCSRRVVLPSEAPFCDPDLEPRDQPCFWECPDPTEPCFHEYHASFTLDADRDQVYLYDTEERAFGRIHGVEFDDPGIFPEGVPTDMSLSLIPNAAGGFWQLAAAPTPGCPNQGPCPEPPYRRFYRGDANSDCAVDIADGLFILNYLFMGTSAPTCPDAADVNDTGWVNISDSIFLFGYLFLGRTPPPPPQPWGLNFTGPGVDPTCDDLPSCEAVTCQ